MVYQETIGAVDRVRAILSKSTAQLSFICMSKKKLIIYSIVVLPKLGYERIVFTLL